MEASRFYNRSYADRRECQARLAPGCYLTHTSGSEGEAPIAGGQRFVPRYGWCSGRSGGPARSGDQHAQCDSEQAIMRSSQRWLNAKIPSNLRTWQIIDMVLPMGAGLAHLTLPIRGLE